MAALWLRGLALVWGCAGTALAQLSTTAPPAPAQACSEFSQRSCEECLKNVSENWEINVNKLEVPFSGDAPSNAFNPERLDQYFLAVQAC